MQDPEGNEHCVDEHVITVTPDLYDQRVIGLADVRELAAAATTLTRGVEPAAVALPDAVSMWESLDAVERKISAAKTLLARRVDESRAWKRSGYRSAAEFMAARSGSSIGAA